MRDQIKRDTNIVVENANILNMAKNLVFVLSQWVREELKLGKKDVKPVDAKDALLKISSIEEKIQSTNRK
jgi:hypothetical protein